MHISTMLVFSSLVLWFGIVWCWRSICCFWLLASLPYMSIRARIVVAVTLHEIDNAPNAKSGSKCHNKGLQNVYCAIEKCHEYILSAASAAVRQADKRRSAYGRRRIKKPPCDKGGVPTPRKSCGAAVFSCKGLGGASPGRGAYHVAHVYVLDFRSAP